MASNTKSFSLDDSSSSITSVTSSSSSTQILSGVPRTSSQRRTRSVANQNDDTQSNTNNNNLHDFINQQQNDNHHDFSSTIPPNNAGMIMMTNQHQNQNTLGRSSSAILMNNNNNNNNLVTIAGIPFIPNSAVVGNFSFGSSTNSTGVTLSPPQGPPPANLSSSSSSVQVHSSQNNQHHQDQEEAIETQTHHHHHHQMLMISPTPKISSSNGSSTVLMIHRQNGLPLIIPQPSSPPPARSSSTSSSQNQQQHFYYQQIHHHHPQSAIFSSALENTTTNFDSFPRNRQSLQNENIMNIGCAAAVTTNNATATTTNAKRFPYFISNCHIGSGGSAKIIIGRKVHPSEIVAVSVKSEDGESTNQLQIIHNPEFDHDMTLWVALKQPFTSILTNRSGSVSSSGQKPSPTSHQQNQFNGSNRHPLSTVSSMSSFPYFGNDNVTSNNNNQNNNNNNKHVNFVPSSPESSVSVASQQNQQQQQQNFSNSRRQSGIFTEAAATTTTTSLDFSSSLLLPTKNSNARKIPLGFSQESSISKQDLKNLLARGHYERTLMNYIPKHPAIVDVLHATRDYMVMPLMHGDLAKFIQKRKPSSSSSKNSKEGGILNEAQVRRILFILAKAVHHLHENEIVHRDLKPSNVLVKKIETIDIKNNNNNKQDENENDDAIQISSQPLLERFEICLTDFSAAHPIPSPHNSPSKSSNLPHQNTNNSRSGSTLSTTPPPATTNSSRNHHLRQASTASSSQNHHHHHHHHHHLRQDSLHSASAVAATHQNSNHNHSDQMNDLWNRGSPGYRPPEVLLGRRAAAHQGYADHQIVAAADIWGLGCIAVEMLLGKKQMFSAGGDLPDYSLILNWLVVNNNQNGKRKSSRSSRKRSSQSHNDNNENEDDDDEATIIMQEQQEAKLWKEIRKQQKGISPSCIDLLKSLLELNPTKRATSQQVLLHEFFNQERGCEDCCGKCRKKPNSKKTASCNCCMFVDLPCNIVTLPVVHFPTTSLSSPSPSSSSAFSSMKFLSNQQQQTNNNQFQNSMIPTPTNNNNYYHATIATAGSGFFSASSSSTSIGITAATAATFSNQHNTILYNGKILSFGTVGATGANFNPRCATELLLQSGSIKRNPNQNNNNNTDNTTIIPPIQMNQMKNIFGNNQNDQFFLGEKIVPQENQNQNNNQNNNIIGETQNISNLLRRPTGDACFQVSPQSSMHPVLVCSSQERKEYFIQREIKMNANNNNNNNNNKKLFDEYENDDDEEHVPLPLSASRNLLLDEDDNEEENEQKDKNKVEMEMEMEYVNEDDSFGPPKQQNGQKTAEPSPDPEYPQIVAAPPAAASSSFLLLNNTLTTRKSKNANMEQEEEDNEDDQVVRTDDDDENENEFDQSSSNIAENIRDFKPGYLRSTQTAIYSSTNSLKQFPSNSTSTKQASTSLGAFYTWNGSKPTFSSSSTLSTNKKIDSTSSLTSLNSYPKSATTSQKYFMNYHENQNSIQNNNGIIRSKAESINRDDEEDNCNDDDQALEVIVEKEEEENSKIGNRFVDAHEAFIGRKRRQTQIYKNSSTKLTSLLVDEEDEKGKEEDRNNTSVEIQTQQAAKCEGTPEKQLVPMKFFKKRKAGEDIYEKWKKAVAKKNAESHKNNDDDHESNSSSSSSSSSGSDSDNENQENNNQKSLSSSSASRRRMVQRNKEDDATSLSESEKKRRQEEAIRHFALFAMKDDDQEEENDDHEQFRDKKVEEDFSGNSNNIIRTVVARQNQNSSRQSSTIPASSVSPFQRNLFASPPSASTSNKKNSSQYKFDGEKASLKLFQNDTQQRQQQHQNKISNNNNNNKVASLENRIQAHVLMPSLFWNPNVLENQQQQHHQQQQNIPMSAPSSAFDPKAHAYEKLEFINPYYTGKSIFGSGGKTTTSTESSTSATTSPGNGVQNHNNHHQNKNMNNSNNNNFLNDDSMTSGSDVTNSNNTSSATSYQNNNNNNHHHHNQSGNSINATSTPTGNAAVTRLDFT